MESEFQAFELRQGEELSEDQLLEENRPSLSASARDRLLQHDHRAAHAGL